MKKGNLLNILLVFAVVLIVFVPSAKALLIRGLMEVGFFSPSTNKPVGDLSVDLSSIKFKDVNGKVVSLSQFEGKIIFLNFWATWCPPCLAEMPSINRLHKAFPNNDEVVFIMVDADGNLKKAEDYMARKGYRLPVYALSSDIPERIFKGSLPTTIVFDKKGRISLQGEGAADYSSKKFLDFIRKLKTID